MTFSGGCRREEVDIYGFDWFSMKKKSPVETFSPIKVSQMNTLSNIMSFYYLEKCLIIK